MDNNNNNNNNISINNIYIALNPLFVHGEVDIGTLCPTGYRFFHIPRSYSLGGGDGLLFKETINVNSQITDTFESFEYMNARLRCLQGIRILVIYRPPGRSSYDSFYKEFSKLIEQMDTL